MLTYNQFQSKFKGLGLTKKQIGRAWAKYKTDEIHNEDLILINIIRLVEIIKKEIPKSPKKVTHRVSLKMKL